MSVEKRAQTMSNPKIDIAEQMEEAREALADPGMTHNALIGKETLRALLSALEAAQAEVEEERGKVALNQAVLNSHRIRAETAEADVARLKGEAVNWAKVEERAIEAQVAAEAALEQSQREVKRLTAERNNPNGYTAQLAGTVVKLRSKIHDDLIPRAEASEAREARMREALEPFANLGVTSGPDEEPCTIPYRITRGSIRRARQVLKEGE